MCPRHDEFDMTSPIHRNDSPPSLSALRAQVARLQDAATEHQEVISSGNSHLDRLLPRGGFARGTLVEWVAERGEAAAGTLAILTAWEAARAGGYLVILDGCSRFYAPAAAAWGVDLQRTLVIRAANTRDQIWALDQALRCPGVSAVWAPISHLDRQLDASCLRRWQLAAEQGGTLGLLIRSAQARQLPCWSDAQLQVTVRGGQGSEETWRLGVELLKVRGGVGGAAVELLLQAGQPWHMADSISQDNSAGGSTA